MGEEWETGREEPGLSASSKLLGSVQYHLLRGPSRGLAGKRVMGFAEPGLSIIKVNREGCVSS